jgi:hypothetical protein
MPQSTSVKWTREDELVALNLYGKLPFGQFDKGNTVIIDVASRMGRTSSSLAMKLSNLASLDPVQKARGIKGLSGATKQDREMWNEFHSNINELAPESEQLLHDLFTTDDKQEVDFLERDQVRIEPPANLTTPSGPAETIASIRIRRGQHFFRQTVLNSYGIRCCISGINVPHLLVASHIKPWHKFPNERLDPRNGLCLSSLHDAAFDAGLITLDSNFKVVLSRRLRSFLPQTTLEHNFIPFENSTICLPEKLGEPSQHYLNYHRRKIFMG